VSLKDQKKKEEKRNLARTKICSLEWKL